MRVSWLCRGRWSTYRARWCPDYGDGAMSRALLCGGTVYARGGVLEPGWVLVDAGKIVDLGEGHAPRSSRASRLDVSGYSIVPGYIDLHVHGALGHDTMDASADGLLAMARYYAQHGVTSFLATTVTASPGAIAMALHNVTALMHAPTGGARVLGAHIEGPYIDRDKVGAQNATFVRCPEPNEYRHLLSRSSVRLVTVAPEIDGAQGLIAEACRRGIVVSAGHTRATYDEMRQAVSAGVTHVTHLFNGMEPMHHRSPGVVGAALTSDELTCEVIADNIHIHPAVLALAVRAKGTGGLVLVTDAMRGAGMADGVYDLGGLAVTMEHGEARLANGVLAGSTLTMDRAVVNIMAAAGLSLGQALPMATQNPARVLNLHTKGALAPGLDADLIALDAEGDVALTMVGGEIVHRDF